jgi:nucleoside-diphosphate-sugar epimerase
LTIVVTGAGGFIGSHLVRRLGHQAVIAVCRSMSPGTLDSSAFATRVDMARPGWTRSLPPRADSVVHLAQSRSHRAFPEGAEDVVHVNVDATFELLNWARQSGVQRFVFASTGTVYPSQNRLIGEDDRVSPTSFYAASKIAAESLCSPFSKFFDVTILRPFGVYGPGGKDSVINRLVERVLLQRPIELDEGLGLITTPTYIDDCIDVLERILSLSARNDVPRIINVCGSDEVSLRDVCSVAADVAGVPLSIQANNKPATRLSGSNSRAKQLLDWSPRYTLRDGLSALVEASARERDPRTVIP